MSCAVPPAETVSCEYFVLFLQQRQAMEVDSFGSVVLRRPTARQHAKGAKIMSEACALLKTQTQSSIPEV